MTILIGVDLETTSLNVETCQITEVGIAIFDCDELQIVETFGGLVLPMEYFPPSDITGITHEMATKFGRAISVYLNYIAKHFTQDCFLVGHNAFAFDKPILERNFVGLTAHLQEAAWIDTMIDVPYPDNIGSKALVSLCAQHGFLNPFPHRAVFDVAAMLKLMNHYHIPTILEVAKTPLQWYRAHVSFNSKDNAKQLRYRWDGTNKFWVKQVRKYYKAVEQQDAAELDFDITELPGYVYERQYL